MTNTYGTIITAVGAAKIAQAIAEGDSVVISAAAAGDGNGEYYKPTPDQTELKHEVWRGSIESAEISETTENMIDVTIVIGEEVGGFIIREMALFDEDGDMIAVCNTPDTEKAAISEGISGKFTMVMHILVADSSVVEFRFPEKVPSLSLGRIGRDWIETTTTEQTDMQDICYGDGVYIAVGVGGRAARSEDRIHWDFFDLPVNKQFNGVCYGNGRFVAVGLDGYTAYSTDRGLTWSVGDNLTSALRKVLYNDVLGKFVCLVGNAGQIATSADGNTWETETVASGVNFIVFCYGDGVMIAIPQNSTTGYRWTEDDGWEQITIPADSWGAGCYGAGKFVVLRRGNASSSVMSKSMVSTDGGNTWTQSSEFSPASPWIGIAYGEGIFVAVSTFTLEGRYPITSADGLHWEKQTMKSFSYRCAICYGDGAFVAARITSHGFDISSTMLVQDGEDVTDTVVNLLLSKMGERYVPLTRKINGQSLANDITLNVLPNSTAEDAGKFMRVDDDGDAAWEALDAWQGGDY